MDPAVIKNCYLFENATPEDLAALQRLFEPKDVLRGDQIYLPSEQPDALYLIATGAVSITIRDKDIAVLTLGGGQSFGELPFFHHQERNVSAHATEQCRLLRLPFASLGKLLEERPALAVLVYRNAAAQYARMVGRLSAELDRPYF